MKIAMIGTTLFHQGAEYVLATIARGMAAHGHDITVILSKYHEDWQKAHPDWKPFELGANVKVIIQPKHRARESVFSLRKIIKDGNYDVVLSQSGQYTHTLGILSYMLRKRPVFIHVEHKGGIGTDALGNLVTPKFSLKAWLRKWVTSRMDAQFTVSEGTSDAIVRMTGYPRDRIFTVYNPVIDEVFVQKLLGIPNHSWLLCKDVPVVLAAGALCFCKNFPLLLHAWVEVVKKVKARLIIFGEGGMRSELEKMIIDLGLTDSVALPGFTDNLPAALKQASCFVVSSFVESFSIVLVEALGAGVPVVATDCPYGPSEILQDGKYGILVKNDDTHALAQGILKVLFGKGIIPPPEASAPYRTEAIVVRYEKAIEEVLKRKKRGL